MTEKKPRIRVAFAAARVIGRAMMILYAALASAGQPGLEAAGAGFVRGDFYATSSGTPSIAHYDATGALLDPISVDVPRGTQLHGLAQGPDGFLYVVAAALVDPAHAYTVLVLNVRGGVVRRYEGHSVITTGAIVFDAAGNFEVTTPEGFAFFRRGEDSAPLSFRLSGKGFAETSLQAVTLLPNGNLLAAGWSHLYEVRPDGVFVREIKTSPPLDRLTGLACDAAGSAVYVTMLGENRNFDQLLKIDLATGRLLHQVFVLRGVDVVGTPDGRVVTGSFEVGPQVFSTDLQPLGAFPGDPQSHITQIRIGIPRSGGKQP